MSPGSGSANHKSDFLGIDGTWTKALRFITPAAVVAILVAIFNAGGTLTHIDDLATQNCQALAQTQTALHKEHMNDRYKGIFPAPPHGGCRK